MSPGLEVAAAAVVVAFWLGKRLAIIEVERTRASSLLFLNCSCKAIFSGCSSCILPTRSRIGILDESVAPIFREQPQIPKGSSALQLNIIVRA